MRKDLGDNGSKHSPILGWANDGYPIYGPYGYSNANDASSSITIMKSCYQLKSSRTGTSGVPPTSTYPLGT